MISSIILHIIALAMWAVTLLVSMVAGVAIERHDHDEAVEAILIALALGGIAYVLQVLA